MKGTLAKESSDQSFAKEESDSRSEVKPYGSWHTSKYYTIKSPLSKSIKLLVSAGLGIHDLGMNEKTIRNGVSKFQTSQSSAYRFFRDDDAIMLDYENIPANVKSKAGLPICTEEMIDLLKAKYQMKQDIHRDVEFNHLKESLKELYHNRWPPFLKFYLEKIENEKERILYAKSHAIIEGVIRAREQRWAGALVFDAFSQVMRDEIDAVREPVFFTASPVYFWRKISNCGRFGIPQTLVHDSRGVPREYRVLMTGQIKAFARLKFRDDRRYTIRSIVEMIAKKFNVTLSHSSLKRIKSKNLDRQILEYDSNGKIYSRQNGLPKITRFLAEGPGEQYQGDFYKLQFYCRLHTGAVVRLWAYVVLDVFSKKIVGWALSEKCLATQAKNAFKMAFVAHQILPEEIIVDNDSIYKRKIFKRFMRRLNNLGVITTKAYPNIPTWKAEIESGFAVFQKLHSSKPWFIGEDITSQSNQRTGNPSDELRKALYRDTKNMLTVSEMHNEFAKMVQEYNAMTNDRKKKVSPQDTYRLGKSTRTIQLLDWMVPLLFWKARTKKRIKDDGRIDLQIDNVEYRYQVTEAEMLWTYKNTDVRMCYDPADHSKVYIFERGTLKFIGVVEPRMVMNRGNKAEVLRKQKRILREAQQYLKDGRETDEKLAAGLVPDRKPITREKLADKIIRRKMKQKKFEAAVAAVPIHK